MMDTLREKLQRRLDKLDSERSQLSEDLEALNRIEQRYSSNSGDWANGKFSMLKLEEAAIQVLNSVFPKNMRAAQISEQIRNGGYQTKSSNGNFTQGVGFILGRLVKSDQIIRVETGLYQAKEPT